MSKDHRITVTLAFLAVFACVGLSTHAEQPGPVSTPATALSAGEWGACAVSVESPAPGVPPDSFTPVVCRISFCSQTIGYKCVNTGTCPTGGCHYFTVEDENCTVPDDPPPNLCGGCF